MSKLALVDRIIEVLESELAALTRGAQASFAAATDPDSKAENKYDTRTLEASYVARGQARRVVELREALQQFMRMAADGLARHEKVAMGSLVTLQEPEGYDSLYFIGPAAGGTEVVWQQKELLVITPASPLGQKLMGKSLNDSIALRERLQARIAALE